MSETLKSTTLASVPTLNVLTVLIETILLKTSKFVKIPFDEMIDCKTLIFPATSKSLYPISSSITKPPTVKLPLTTKLSAISMLVFKT